MKKKFVIIVEGGADAVFIKDFICSILFPSVEGFEVIKKFDNGKKIKICDSPEIHLFIAGGCTHVEKYKVSIRELQDQEYKILMIQDADDPNKDIVNGGVEKRNLYLEKIKNEFNIDFQTFLFPNNLDNGDLETVLLSIVNLEKFSPFIQSYNDYSNKVKEFSNEQHALELLENKYLVFNYCQVYNGVKNSNEKNRTYKTHYWDLTKETLNPLKDFLTKELDIIN